MRRSFLYLALSLLFCIHSNTQADLLHRYSFTNGDPNAIDSVGGKNGTLKNGATISGDAVQLGEANGYVNLPGNLITGYTAVSFEVWFTRTADSGTWTRVWDFGDTNPSTHYGRKYVFFTPKSSSSTFRYAISDADPGYGNENYIETTPTATGVPVYVAVVHNGTTGEVKLYVNGALAESGTFSIPLSSVNNVYSYLGKSLYNDPYLKGSIDEFRIYNSILTPQEIAYHNSAGPDVIRPSPVVTNETNGSTEVTEGNSTPDTYTVALSSLPGANVTLTVDPDEQLDIGSGPGNSVNFVFHTYDWNSPRTIEVRAFDDDVLEAEPHIGLISHSISSNDPNFNNKPLPSVYVTIWENECGAWGFNYSDLNYDCLVNFKDFAIFASYWLSPLNPITLETLALEWLSCTTPNAPDCEHADEGGYLFSYFTSETGGLRLAYSYDGLDWTVLNSGGSFLVPTVGSGLMRDPCIIRGPDGLFRMVWTTGWWDQGIGYASSSDLIHWSAQQFVPVMTYEPDAENCWAPEVFYDKAKERYQIFWATTITGEWNNEHRIYYVTTEDFNTFSTTALFFEQGFNVIDATILEDNQQFYMFVKNETVKNIRMTTADHADGPWGPVSNPITPTGCEGPTAIKIEDKYILYFDKYTQGTFGAMESADLQTWTDISGQLNMPSGARHGTVFRVSSDILDNLIDY
ncbi:MAG: hypothetical protein MUO89_09320 [Dehalococcoidia bacterium]|nr:hypothetical protein [Dehalococcoidia bacterium]